MANIPKFKKGDIIKPIVGKKQSNYMQLKDVEELVVINPDLSPSYTKKLMHVSVQKGVVMNNMNYSTYHKGDRIQVYEDAFELVVKPEEDYEIY